MLIILVVFILLSIVTINVFIRYFEKDSVTETIPGLRSVFKPIENFKKAKQFAGNNAKLVSIESQQVESDGIINFINSYKPAPRVAYFFTRPYVAPVEKKNKDNKNKKIGTYTRVVKKKKLKPKAPIENIKIYITSYKETATQMKLQIVSNTNIEPEVSEPPLCSFKKIWQLAIKNNAPKNATAYINYKSGVYQFCIIQKYKINYKKITDTIFLMKVDNKCNVIDLVTHKKSEKKKN